MMAINDAIGRYSQARAHFDKILERATSLGSEVDAEEASLRNLGIMPPTTVSTPPALGRTIGDARDAAIQVRNRESRTSSTANALQHAEYAVRAAELHRDALATKVLDRLFCWIGRESGESKVRKAADRRLQAEDSLRLAKQELDAARADARRALGNLLAAATVELKTQLEGGLRARSDAETELAALPTALAAAWTQPAWTSWTAKDPSGQALCMISPNLRIGRLEPPQHAPQSPWVDWFRHALPPCERPVLIPFLGGERSFIVSAGSANSRAALDLVHAMVIRIAAMMGPLVSFTFIDPAGNGKNFPFQRHLKSRTPSADALRDLQEIEGSVRRINRDLLDPNTCLHQLPERRLASETFEIVVAADFPRRYDRRTIEALSSLATTGPRAGRYVIIHHNEDEPLPRDMSLADFSNALSLKVHGGHATIQDITFVPDQAPPDMVRDRVLSELNSAERAPSAIPFDELIDCSDGNLWKASSQHWIATPVGLRGGHDSIPLWFGARDGRTCAHGMLAGMPGSGKSTLYHVLIMGLACAYSPDELRLFLIDGKFGTEFSPYQSLPHAKVVSLNTPPDLARSVLRELVNEMSRRNQMFRTHGVQDLTAYRQSTGSPLERIVLMVDEYQQLFENDANGDASDLMRRLAQQGRSAGIHMFLGSQRFGAPGMIHQQDIFSNIHLKMAMKLQPDEVMGLSEFGPTGKAIIRDCDVAGKFALNDTGQDDRTIPGRAAMLDPAKRDALIDKLKRRAHSQIQPPTILRGDQSPTIESNSTITYLLSSPAGPTPAELELIARADPSSGRGFGKVSWQASDRPIPLALGRELTVHGHATAALRRSIAQNLLVVGSHQLPRLGMLCGAVVCAIAAAESGCLAIDCLTSFMDPSDPQHHAVETLRTIAARARSVEFNLHQGPDAALAALQDAAVDVAQRATQQRPHARSRLVIIMDPDRLPTLHETAESPWSRTSTGAEALRSVLTSGSLVGVHVILAAASTRQAALAVHERRSLPQFNHRVALQLTESDSFLLFGHRRGAIVQDPDDPVAMALYADLEANYTCRLRPYSPLSMADING
jgi:S-DNA-T family DNA segregation ATPase FtsK/SpoIIIE